MSEKERERGTGKRGATGDPPYDNLYKQEQGEQSRLASAAFSQACVRFCVSVSHAMSLSIAIARCNERQGYATSEQHM